MTWFKCIGQDGGGGGEAPQTGYTLFKNGQFYNQDKMTFNISNYVIENGCIKVSGASINGLAVATSTITDKYTLEAIAEAATNTPYVQIGRSTLGSNINDIVASGTGRLSYSNLSFSSGNDYNVTIQANNNEGVFISLGDATGYIKEISIHPADEIVIHRP